MVPSTAGTVASAKRTASIFGEQNVRFLGGDGSNSEGVCGCVTCVYEGYDDVGQRSVMCRAASKKSWTAKAAVVLSINRIKSSVQNINMHSRHALNVI